jgi:hypothetical protein
MGVPEKIPLSAVTVPLPSLPEPFQFAVAERFIVYCFIILKNIREII